MDVFNKRPEFKLDDLVFFQCEEYGFAYIFGAISKIEIEISHNDVRFKYDVLSYYKDDSKNFSKEWFRSISEDKLSSMTSANMGLISKLQSDGIEWDKSRREAIEKGEFL